MSNKKGALQELAEKMTGNDEHAATREMLQRYWNISEGSRKELDWRWFNYDLWVSGNHYAKWDKNTQQITTSPRSDGRPKIVINKVYTTLRSVRSYVLQNRPKADVTPHDMTPDTVEQAAQLNDYLGYLHDHLHLGQSLRASLWHALKYSVGWWQVLWDENAQDGEGEVQINVVDPYDLYVDPVARIPKEARFMCLAVRRSLEDLKQDPKYKDVDWDGIGGDRFLAASPLKSRLMAAERGDVNFNKDKKDQTAIVKEFWYKSYEDEEAEVDDYEAEAQEDGSPAKKTVTKKKAKIYLATMIHDKIIRGPIDTGLDRFPFFRLSSDIEPLQMYGTGWVKHIIPVNRLLERLESSAAEYNDLVNKGKWISDKGAGVRMINNEHGQIIEKKRGFEVTGAPIPPIDGSLIFNQITNANRYIEDIGAMHDASLGRIPAGAKSGVAIETLMEGDSNNLSELVENTEEFLEDVYEYVLYLASQKYQFLRNVITVTTTGEKQFMSVIGEKAAPDLQQSPGATVIPSKNIVDVKIQSWLAYTQDGRRQAVEQLGQLMNQNGYQLPVDFILQAFETGDIANTVKKMQAQMDQQQQQQAQQQQQQQQSQMQGQMQMDQHKAGLAQQQQAQQASQQAQQDQQAAQQGQAGAPQAIALIRSLINGQMPELPKQVGPDFIKYLDAFMQSPEGKQLGGAFLSEIQKLRDQAVMEMQHGDVGQVVN